MFSSVAFMITPVVNFSNSSSAIPNSRNRIGSRNPSFKYVHATDTLVKSKRRNSPNDVVIGFREPSLSSPAARLQRLVTEFKTRNEPIERVKLLLEFSTWLPPMNDSAKVVTNKVKGCTADVWLDARMDESGRVWFEADSDSMMARGFCGCLIWVMDGAAAVEVAEVTAEDLSGVNVGGVGGNVNSRVNTWMNVLSDMKKRTRQFTILNGAV